MPGAGKSMLEINYVITIQNVIILCSENQKNYIPMQHLINILSDRPCEITILSNMQGIFKLCVVIVPKSSKCWANRLNYILKLCFVENIFSVLSILKFFSISNCLKSQKFQHPGEKLYQFILSDISFFLPTLTWKDIS